MYIYNALINALSTHMIHIKLNMILCTHVGHSPTKTVYIKHYTKNKTKNTLETQTCMHARTYARTHASTHTHTHTHTQWLYQKLGTDIRMILVRMESSIRIHKHIFIWQSMICHISKRSPMSCRLSYKWAAQTKSLLTPWSKHMVSCMYNGLPLVYVV